MADEKPTPKIFKVYGREFDMGTDQGMRDAQIWSEAHESARGKLAQEVGDLRKEVEPLRKYNLKGATMDEIGLRKKVASLREEGNHVEADNLLFEFGRQSRIDADLRLERERLFADYKEARPEIFEALPFDMAKSYVLSNYQKELEESDDPIGLIDRILKPKVAKKAASEDVPAVLGKASSPSTKEDPKGASKEKDKEEPSGAMNKVLEEFGFK